jgi:hypothetical protein
VEKMTRKESERKERMEFPQTYSHFAFSFENGSPLFTREKQDVRSAPEKTDSLGGLFCGPFGEPYRDPWQDDQG